MGLRFVFGLNNGLTFGRELDDKFEYVHAGNISPFLFIGVCQAKDETQQMIKYVFYVQ